MSRLTGRARAQRRQSTGAEEKLWSALRNRALNGYKFRRQYPIERYVADFACIEARLVVEVDGATHGAARERLRDLERTDVLARCGYEVLRVTNADVFENLDGVHETILAALKHRTTI